MSKQWSEQESCWIDLQKDDIDGFTKILQSIFAGISKETTKKSERIIFSKYVLS